MSAPLRLGTRGSALALAQAEWVSGALRVKSEVVVVETDDDSTADDKARFVRGVEQALLRGDVDVAIHSAKDLPSDGPDGIEIASVPEREDVADAICGPAGSLEELPRGARVGTASLRRRSQLLALRPDLAVVELRGNVDTRLRKLADGEADAIILAAAGLRRLGLEREIAFRLSPEEMTPAPGQGALAIEVRSDDEVAAKAVARISEAGAALELAAERAAVAELGASCDTPVGVSARHEKGKLRLAGYAGMPDGSTWVRDAITASAEDPEAAGRELAARMIAAGAAEILRHAHSSSASRPGERG